MSRKLYPNYADDELRRDLKRFTELQNQRIFMALDGELYAGFIMVSIRTDYVEGASSSPTGYLEAIYIEPDHRRKGLSRKLIAIGEQWVKTRGCSEMGSDTWLWNEDSIQFHKSMGFAEEDRLVHFIKKL